jgi:hypothetical protein
MATEGSVITRERDVTIQSLGIDYYFTTQQMSVYDTCRHIIVHL